VTVAIFGSFSAVGLLANALAIPVFTLLLVPPVLLATACHLLPGRLMGWCGDLLVDLTAAVAAALWPFLAWCAGLPGALWRTEAPLSWFLLAGPAVLAALLPVPRVLRATGLALLVSTFLLRDQRPRAGELWIDVPDAGRSSAIMLRTRERLLLWGTGESFGARGRAFARHVLPMLRTSGYGVLDLWLPGNLSRDTQVALTLGAAEIPVQQTLMPPARGVPPEMSPCQSAHWEWDGITFEVEVSGDGRACTLTASAGDQLLLLGAEDAPDLPAAAGETLRLVLDAAGIRQRGSHLRL
jgi:competence protein ComEC